MIHSRLIRRIRNRKIGNPKTKIRREPGRKRTGRKRIRWLISRSAKALPLSLGTTKDAKA